MNEHRPGRGAFAIAAAGMAAFIVYGSLIPFEFRDRSWSEAVESFRWTVTHRVWPASRSDWIANVLLGVTLGFFLLGAFRTGRSSFWGSLLTAILLWPICVALAVAVEFGQLFVPGRTAAGSDVIAQGLGAAVGMLGWMDCGTSATRRLAEAARRQELHDTATRMLLGYLAVLALVLYLPLDLTLSPVEAARKLYRSVTLEPFGDFAGFQSDKGWEQVQHWVELGLVYVPVGLLGSRLVTQCPSKRWWPAWAVGIPLILELGQLFVQSRLPSGSGVVVGVIGTMIGWGLGRCRFSLGLRLGLALWFCAMIVVMWQPFNFAKPDATSMLVGLPFEDIQFSQALRLLDQFVTRIVVYALLGVAVGAMIESRRWVSMLMAAITGSGAAIVFELGQFYLPGRTPSATDLVLAFLGASLGAWLVALVPSRPSQNMQGTV